MAPLTRQGTPRLVPCGQRAELQRISFSTQCIPTEADVLAVKGYRAFFAERRHTTTVRLNEDFIMAGG